MSSNPRWRSLSAALLIALPQAKAAQSSPVAAAAPAAELRLEAFWEPCRESMYKLFAETEVLRAPKPAEGVHGYGAADFAPFVPAEGLEVGATWAVDPQAVLVFLRQFHGSARSTLHHGYGAFEGAWACLRARSEERVEVLFRAHAEFELEGGVTFTPAQFEGRLVLDRARALPLFASIALPSRNTNVDVNVPTDDWYEPAPGMPKVRGSSADIGWVPRMELVGGDASAIDPARAWPSAVPLDEARTLLARRFYPFLAIQWLPFEQAAKRAVAEGKPLHVMQLFGTLDDESC